MPKSLKLSALLTALLVMLVVPVAGCGGGDSSSAATSAGTEPVDPSSLRDGGELTIAATSGAATLDPYKFLYTFEEIVDKLMYSSLTRYTIDGGDEVQPGLAESWTPSDGFRTFDFKLRSGLEFSNGKPLTTDAVVSSLERAFDPKTAFVWAFSLPTPKAIEAPDSKTVRITLDVPERNLPAALTSFPIMDVSAFDQVNRDPVVTGPFKVSSFTPDQELVVVPNEHYYGDPPKLDQITVTKAQDNSSAFASLQAGDIQALWSPPWTDVRQLGGAGGDDIEVTTSPEDPVQFAFLETDNQHGVFADVKARQALAYAIDREAISQAIYADRGVPAEDNNPVPSSSDLVADDLPISYEYDLDKAKELFDEAGVGPETKLTFIAPSDQYPEWKPTGEVLQSSLKEIGINMEIEASEIGTFASRFAPAGQTWPNLIAPNSWGGLPVPLMMNWFAPGVCECNFDNADFNEARAQAAAAPDDPAFREAFGRLQEILNEQAPAAIAVHADIPVVQLSEVKNIWIEPTGLAHFADAGYAE